METTTYYIFSAEQEIKGDFFFNFMIWYHIFNLIFLVDT